MKGIIAGIAICVIGIIVVVIIALNPGEPAKPRPATPPSSSSPNVESTPSAGSTEPAAFEPIVFTGSSTKKSVPFMVTTQEWIIDWSYTPNPRTPESAAFNVIIYPEGETELPVESVIASGETSGSNYSDAGPGEYYIHVLAANVESWEVTIRPP